MPKLLIGLILHLEEHHRHPEGEAKQLRKQWICRFGALPEWAEAKLAAAELVKSAQ